MALKRRNLDTEFVYALYTELSVNQQGIIVLYSGTPVTAPNFTVQDDYTAQELATWTLGPYNTTTRDLRFDTNRRIAMKQLDPPDMFVREDSINRTITATGTGTATWFAVFSTRTPTSTRKALMTGTVSTINGGGDLTLENTNVVTGQPVQLLEFEFSVNYSTI